MSTTKPDWRSMADAELEKAWPPQDAASEAASRDSRGMTEDAHEFTVRVNDGPERTITVATSLYRDAAAAVPALMGVMVPCMVEISAIGKTFLYRIREDEYGGLVVEHCMRATHR